MSVKYGILALLADGEKYGAQLRALFEARTGGTWPLNVGQVYTTLGRLERDGLVSQAEQSDDEGRISYRLTNSGRTTVEQWWTSPVDRENSPRDELVIKLALAVTAVGIDIPTVVQTQRTATIRHLRDLTRLKQDARAAEHPDLAWMLVLENLIFTSEGEVRWLDYVESALAREAVKPPVEAAPVSTDHNDDQDTDHHRLPEATESRR
ncbi:MAG: PadR family transcriptional regulator [Nocardioides sp.]